MKTYLKYRVIAYQMITYQSQNKKDGLPLTNYYCSVLFFFCLFFIKLKITHTGNKPEKKFTYTI